MTLGIKYCGGCNPVFDRGAFVRRIKQEHPDIVWTTDISNSDYVLVICGCRRGCASHGDINPRLGKTVVVDETDYDAVRAALACR